jgi:hypothetical protein
MRQRQDHLQPHGKVEFDFRKHLIQKTHAGQHPHLRFLFSAPYPNQVRRFLRPIRTPRNGVDCLPAKCDLFEQRRDYDFVNVSWIPPTRVVQLIERHQVLALTA